MTSKLTRERLEKIKSWRETYGAGSNVMLPAEEAEELARIALSAMDSEPVAWTWHYREQWHVTNDEERARDLAWWDAVKVEPLYRHAQQPVVPDDVLDALQKVARIRLDMDGFDGDRRGIADCLCDAEEALIEVVNRRAAMLHAGNSPANPDGLPDGVNIYHGPKEKTILVLKQGVAVNQDCWCRTCRPVTLNDMRFVVCPDCGNKRCPRANDHRNACTGSNEPGQEGSAYPAAPQEVKGE
ncbi:TPA: hypothetical protein ACXEL9_001959 [Klebsiella variicola]